LTPIDIQPHLEHEEELELLRLQMQSLKERYQILQQSMQQMKQALSFQESQKQEAVDEIKSLTSQFAILKAKGASQLSQISQEEEKCRQLKEENKKLLQENEKLKSDLAENQNKVEIVNQAFVEKDRAYLEKENEIKQLLIKNNLENNLFEQMKQQAQEAESRLKFAHQHLAKKVKETTDLNDLLQREQDRLREYEASFSSVDQEMESLKEEEKQSRQQLVLVETEFKKALFLNETIKSEWQAKYELLFEKYTKAETKIQKLTNTSIKFEKMQSLFLQLNSFLSLENNQEDPFPKEMFQEEVLDMQDKATSKFFSYNNNPFE